MKKYTTAIALFMAAVCVLSGCGSDEEPEIQESEYMSFKDEAALKEYVIGTWINENNLCYYVFTEDSYTEYKYGSYTLNPAFNTALENMKSKGSAAASMGFNEFGQTLFLDAWKDSAKSGSITSWLLYYSECYIFSVGDIYYGSYNVLKDGSLRDKDGRILTKLSDDVEAYKNDWNEIVSGYSDQFKTKQAEIAFDIRYAELPSAREVQYDKVGHLGDSFVIKGTAELDDYYNYDYRGLEGAYFCIKIRPTGGTYSDQWYVYGSRQTHKALFDQLMAGSANVTLVCTLYFYNTGSNNMATLENFMVNS